MHLCKAKLIIIVYMAWMCSVSTYTITLTKMVAVQLCKLNKLDFATCTLSIKSEKLHCTRIHPHVFLTTYKQTNKTIILLNVIHSPSILHIFLQIGNCLHCNGAAKCICSSTNLQLKSIIWHAGRRQAFSILQISFYIIH